MWDKIIVDIGYPHSVVSFLGIANDSIFYNYGLDIHKADLDGNNDVVIANVNSTFSPHTGAYSGANEVLFKNELYVATQEIVGTNVKIWRYDPTPSGIVPDWEEVHSLTLDYYNMGINLLANSDSLLLVVTQPPSSSWDEYTPFAHYSDNGDSWYIVSLPIGDNMIGQISRRTLDPNLPITFNPISIVLGGPDFPNKVYQFDPPIVSHVYTIPDGYGYGSSNLHWNTIYDYYISGGPDYSSDLKISKGWENFTSLDSSTNYYHPMQPSNFDYFGLPLYSVDPDYHVPYFHRLQPNGEIISDGYIDYNPYFNGVVDRLFWYKDYAYIMLQNGNANPVWNAFDIYRAYYPIPPTAILQKDFGIEYPIGGV